MKHGKRLLQFWLLVLSVLLSGCSGGLTGTGVGGGDANSTEGVAPGGDVLEGDSEDSGTLPYYKAEPESGIRVACVSDVEFGYENGTWYIYDGFRSVAENWRVATSTDGLAFSDMQAVTSRVSSQSDGEKEYWLPGLERMPGYVKRSESDIHASNSECDDISANLFSIQRDRAANTTRVRSFCTSGQSWFRVENDGYTFSPPGLRQGDLLSDEQGRVFALIDASKSINDASDKFVELYQNDIGDGFGFSLLVGDYMRSLGFPESGQSNVSLSSMSNGQKVGLTISHGDQITGWQLLQVADALPQLVPLGGQTKETSLISVNDFLASGIPIQSFQRAKVMESISGDVKVFVEATMREVDLPAISENPSCVISDGVVSVIVSANLN